MSALEEKSLFVVTTNNSSQTLLLAVALCLTDMRVVSMLSSSGETNKSISQNAEVLLSVQKKKKTQYYRLDALFYMSQDLRGKTVQSSDGCLDIQ